MAGDYRLGDWLVQPLRDCVTRDGESVRVKPKVMAVLQHLAQAAGMRGVHAGPLQNAGVVEGLTAVLISVNIRYKIKDAGIRITGLPEEERPVTDARVQ